MLLPGDPPVWHDRQKMSKEDVAAFNRRSSSSTALAATGLFEAGITWAGVMFMDDVRTVDYLASRPEVDPDRIGCCGLSVGGFRSAHLAGLDARIRGLVLLPFDRADFLGVFQPADLIADWIVGIDFHGVPPLYACPLGFHTRVCVGRFAW